MPHHFISSFLFGPCIVIDFIPQTVWPHLGVLPIAAKAWFSFEVVSCVLAFFGDFDKKAAETYR